ncbi:signal recognition particle subunit SRP9, partial [Tremellales sp. Uapishka_1]
MVYLRSWTDFETAAVDLYGKSPNKVRYCVKFASKPGQLVLKLTDDTTCIKYKTHSAIILNRFESLNTRLLSNIANLRPRTRPPPGTETGTGTPAVGAGEDGAMLGGDVEKVESAAAVKAGSGNTGTSTPGGGGKKKKKGKK